MADVRDAGPSFADGYDYTVWPALPAQLYTLSKDLASYLACWLRDTPRLIPTGAVCQARRAARISLAGIAQVVQEVRLRSPVSIRKSPIGFSFIYGRAAAPC
jgi:hypothetical protein